MKKWFLKTLAIVVAFASTTALAETSLESQSYKNGQVIVTYEAGGPTRKIDSITLKGEYFTDEKVQKACSKSQRSYEGESSAHNLPEIKWAQVTFECKEDSVVIDFSQREIYPIGLTISKDIFEFKVSVPRLDQHGSTNVARDIAVAKTVYNLIPEDLAARNYNDGTISIIVK